MAAVGVARIFEKVRDDEARQFIMIMVCVNK